jgi:hypothetical protein
MFIASLFIRVQTRNNSKYPPLNEWIKTSLLPLYKAENGNRKNKLLKYAKLG